MFEIVDTKLITETEKGTLIKCPTTIQFKDGRIFFLKSSFSLKSEIKTMAGSRWHGYIEGDKRKIWSVADCARNRFQLGYLQGENVYEWFDRELVRREYERPLMPHQCDMADAGLTYHFQIWAAEMGCVDGEAIVHVNRAGRGFKMRLCDLHHKFHGGETRGRSWDLSIPTYIRSLKENSFGLHLLRNTVAQECKEVVIVTLENGHSIRVTPDHEFYTPDLALVRADRLQCKDQVIVSRLMPGTSPWESSSRSDCGEYVWKCHTDHPRAGRRGMMHEHVLVMESYLGRYLSDDEVVHHINGRKDDNRIDNLQLMKDSEHKRLHARQDGFLNLSGGLGSVDFRPSLGAVKSVEPCGECEVYDLVMADPYRNFVANGFLVKNCGKTLSAQEVMERSATDYWYWVGPKTSLPNIRREFRKWSMDPMICVEMMTYETLVRKIDDWKADDELPRGVIFDESSKLKTPTSQRSKAAQRLADMIRAEYGFDGYVILMSGTPSPKTPLDWYSQAEIAWPGFLREGSVKALEQRLAFMADREYDAGVFKKRIGWKDDESKCAVCGETEIEGPHELDGITDLDDYHRFEPSKNEVAYMYERLSGLVIIKHKKDCLSLPEKRYRKIVCKPAASTLRVAQAIAASAPNAVTGMTLLRELSDGFQYREVKNGKTKCPHCPESCGIVHEWFDPEDEGRTFRAIDMLDESLVSQLEKREVDCPRCGGSGEVDKMKRIVREVPCPKTKALRALLEENEEVGRIVIFAGFTGSVDRVTGICRKDGWDVVRCDGRGFQVTTHDDQVVSDVDPLDYWADVENNPRVAFVAHPESDGMSLTLVEARMAVFWSNSYKPEYRAQAEDRIHRKGMDENLGCTIVDLVHLPTDERVLEIIRENRRLEKMTMGDFTSGISWDAGSEQEAMEVVDAC